MRVGKHSTLVIKKKFTFVEFDALNGQGLRARLSCRKISDSIFWLYYILPPRCLVGTMPGPRKSQKDIYKRKDRTDKRRRRFFYTFLYLLGSTTIPWMREFFLNTLKWLNPQLRCQKYVNSFHVCRCPHLVFRGVT